MAEGKTRLLLHEDFTYKGELLSAGEHEVDDEFVGYLAERKLFDRPGLVERIGGKAGTADTPSDGLSALERRALERLRAEPDLLRQYAKEAAEAEEAASKAPVATVTTPAADHPSRGRGRQGGGADPTGRG